MNSKRFKQLKEKTKDSKPEPIEKLLPELKKNCTTKFNESLDLSFQINNKQKKSEINIRTIVNLPGGTGKKVKVAVVCEDNKAQEAKDAGADIVGSDEFVAEGTKKVRPNLTIRPIEKGSKTKQGNSNWSKKAKSNN